MYVTSIMTYNPVTIGPGESVKSATIKMRTNDIGSLVVMENGKIAGIITERDIVNCVAFSEKKATDVLVEDVMSKVVVTVDSQTSIEKAADLMLKRHIKKLPIVDDGQLTGIVTEKDLMMVVRMLHNIPEVIQKQS